MPSLYHFTTSPFSRRVRLAVAHKGITIDLKDARQSPATLDEMKKMWALRTAPVLVTDEGQIIGDSGAIVRYFDARYIDTPRVFPTEAEALRQCLEITTLVDGALDNIIDVGTRYYGLRNDAAWNAVTTEMLGRAQAALNALGDRVTKSGLGPLTSAGWCAADMWLLTMVAWFDGLPTRRGANQNVDQILSIAWTIPAVLSRWVEAHANRNDVRALG